MASSSNESEVEVPSYCFNSSSSSSAEWASLRTIIFWTEGVGLGLCGAFGVVGNVLTCVVLARISLNNVFNQLIVALCAFDSLFDLISVLEYSLKKGFGLISYSTPVYVVLWPKVREHEV